MNVQPDDHQSLFNWVLGALVSILGYFVNLYRAKIDALLQAQSNAAASFVTRFELQKHMDDMRLEIEKKTDKLHDDSLRMHGENLNRLDRIDDAVVRVHNRFDNHRNGNP
jgi:hypothetical protein